MQALGLYEQLNFRVWLEGYYRPNAERYINTYRHILLRDVLKTPADNLRDESFRDRLITKVSEHLEGDEEICRYLSGKFFPVLEITKRKPKLRELAKIIVFEVCSGL